GVTIVCAAGNEYQKGNPIVYPAAYDAYCIAVGAVRYDEARACYSSTGSYVDISAPGGDMNVDQNNDGYKDGILQQTFSNTPSNFGYWFYQGTSMAAPHVSGIAALLISKGVTGPDAIMNVLKATAKDKGPVGWDAEYGWGIVDAYAALNYVPEVIHDVAVTGIVVVSSCVQGDTVPVTVNAGNSGNYDETFTVVLSDSTSGAEIGRQTTSLPSKGSANLVFQWDTAGAVIGDHTLKAEAQAVSGESNTSNNTATSTITVKDAVHDVAITAINSPLEAGKGDSVSIPVTVKNQGAYAETTLITLTDITDNVSLGSQTLALNVDASTSVLFNWNTSSASLGNHFFRADAGVVSGETNTDNNSMVTTVGTNVKQKAMHIAGIDMALSTRTSGKIKYTRALAALTLVDPGGVPVPGAVISGTWSGATRDSDTGTTNSSGKLTVSSNEVRNPARGTTYTFTVKSVTKTGWTYDSAQNTVTSKSIKVP
ncbi:MAG: S8 family serine peptidase, partial [Candidatus Omnitrophica bacterium]|nr:S8 family serine peptidase [Candidatus Omnitrophota bacterium]